MRESASGSFCKISFSSSFFHSFHAPPRLSFIYVHNTISLSLSLALSPPSLYRSSVPLQSPKCSTTTS